MKTKSQKVITVITVIAFVILIIFLGMLIVGTGPGFDYSDCTYVSYSATIKDIRYYSNKEGPAYGVFTNEFDCELYIPSLDMVSDSAALKDVVETYTSSTAITFSLRKEDDLLSQDIVIVCSLTVEDTVIITTQGYELFFVKGTLSLNHIGTIVCLILVVLIIVLRLIYNKVTKKKEQKIMEESETVQNDLDIDREEK